MAREWAEGGRGKKRRRTYDEAQGEDDADERGDEASEAGEERIRLEKPQWMGGVEGGQAKKVGVVDDYGLCEIDEEIVDDEGAVGAELDLAESSLQCWSGLWGGRWPGV